MRLLLCWAATPLVAVAVVLPLGHQGLDSSRCLGFECRQGFEMPKAICKQVVDMVMVYVGVQLRDSSCSLKKQSFI